MTIKQEILDNAIRGFPLISESQEPINIIDLLDYVIKTSESAQVVEAFTILKKGIENGDVDICNPVCGYKWA